MARSLKTAAPLLAALTLWACGQWLKPLPEIEGVIAKAAAGDDGSLALLVRYFTSPVEGESAKALEALIQAKERAVPHLIKALKKGDPAVAESAAGALGNIKDPRAVQPLMEALERKDFPSYVALWALGEIGRDEAIGTLVKNLGSDRTEVRKYATRALVKFGGRAVPEVIKALDSPDPSARHYAARVLGQSGDRRAVEPLMSRYRSLDPEAALWALGRLGAREALSLIAGEVGNREWKIRLAAVQALAALQDERAIPALKGALEDSEWVVREWAARGLEDTTVERQLYRDQYGKLVVPYNLYR